MKHLARWGTASGLALALATATATGATAYSLPSPNPAYSVTIGSFAVYSLPFLNLFFGTNQYSVASSPGQLGGYLVVGTGPEGAVRDNTDVLGGANRGDDAYGTANTAGNVFVKEDTSKSATFCGPPSSSCLALLEPGGIFTGDGADTWDVQISALNTYLAGGDLIFFFNQNQNRGGAATNEDIFAWALVTLSNTTTNASVLFELTDTAASGNGVIDGSILNPFLSYGFDPSTKGEFVFSPGDQCVGGTAPYPTIHYGPCTNADPSGSITISHNLGANQAAYAITSSALNTDLHSGLYDVMSVRFAFGYANNGYEQIFIAASPVTVPEPATLVLLGAGLTGAAAIAWARGRRRR